MTFRIRRSVRARGVVFALSGELTGPDLAEFTALIKGEETTRLVIDLAEVTLVDREGVELLRRVVADGAELANCPHYIRRWMTAKEDKG